MLDGVIPVSVPQSRVQNCSGVVGIMTKALFFFFLSLCNLGFFLFISISLNSKLFRTGSAE